MVRTEYMGRKVCVPERMTKEAVTAISKAGLCQLNQDVEMDYPPGATAESTRNWGQLQRDDPIVGYVHQKVSNKQGPRRKEHHVIQKLKLC